MPPSLSFHELIRRRRSVRRFSPEAPPAEWIRDLVDDARQAPSAANRQPVRLVRLVSDGPRTALHEAVKSGCARLLAENEVRGGGKKIRNRIRTYFRYAEFMFDVPWLFVLGTVATSPGFSEVLAAEGLIPSAEGRSADADIGVGLFLDHFLLGIEARGLGACALTAPLVFAPDAASILGLPGKAPKSFVAAGYAAEAPAAPERKSVAELYGER